MNEPTCPFCSAPANKIIFENNLVKAFWDAYPVSSGHALVVPKRHFPSLFEIANDEADAIFNAIHETRSIIEKKYSPHGYNIGINEGEAAGQTIMHLHVHVIPRYKSDSEDPRGGIRWIFPDKARYWDK
jgi:diadenosine tetraphosphate (Ap4A) HIT family hydrolase